MSSNEIDTGLPQANPSNEAATPESSQPEAVATAHDSDEIGLPDAGPENSAPEAVATPHDSDEVDLPMDDDASEAKADDKKSAKKSEPEKKKPQQKQENKQENKNKEKKDPMMELVDDLNNFVNDTNKQLTNFIKKIGNKAWDKIADTPPGRALTDAIDQAKQYVKDKVDEKVQGIKDMSPLSAVKDFVSDTKDKIGSAFSNLMNSSAKETELPSLSQSEDSASLNDPMSSINSSNLDAQTSTSTPAPSATPMEEEEQSNVNLP